MSYTNAAAARNHEAPQYIRLRAAAARTKGDPVRISTGHADGVQADVALADDTNVYRIAVAAENAASGDIYNAVIKGTTKMTVASGTYTAGDGVLVVDGAVADSSSAAQDRSGEVGNNDFGIIVTGGSSVTEITVTLFGDPFTATT